MTSCPCGSCQDFSRCCKPYIQGSAIPPTPETLMRSRYTAYSMANIPYIKKTMRGKPLKNFNTIEAENWAKSVLWAGLKIVQISANDQNPHIGFVEFIATYLENGLPRTIHEKSQFKRIEGRWFYVNGQFI